MCFGFPVPEACSSRDALREARDAAALAKREARARSVAAHRLAVAQGL